MSASKHPSVGIDLGTTFSTVAHLDDAGRPQTLVNAEGDLLTPSLVLIDGEEIIVGKEALKAMGTESEMIAECAKRDIGRTAYRKVIGGHQFPPEVIEACVLKKLREDTARRIGEFNRCVITVPAFFDEVRRKATQEAGDMANLEVMDIINEPTAAAVSFGFRQGFLNPDGEAAQELRVLVYDLGGGTFDATLMEIKGNEFTAIATDGDVELGGRDWDQRLVDHVSEQFMIEFGDDPREDPDQAARLWRDCEDAKRTLSARKKASIACDYRGHAKKVEITREMFKELTHDLLDRTQFTTRQLLRTSGMDWGSIDRLLLIGGSSRMPMVRDMLQQLAGKAPDDSVSADEAVAHGAALHAGLLNSKLEGKDSPFRIKNINSHSLGVLATSRKTGRKQNVTLIPRNTPLPRTHKRVFRTQNANQKSVVVDIVEGESNSPDACTLIGKCVIDQLPASLPALSPVEVFFHYAENGRLNVTVHVPGTERQHKQEIQRPASLTPEQRTAWKEWIWKE
ncbi:MAG: Hsp70 family protein [Planctomycetales bacterium]